LHEGNMEKFYGNSLREYRSFNPTQNSEKIPDPEYYNQEVKA